MLSLRPYFKNVIRPVSVDEELKRKEYILNILLIGSITLGFIAMAVIIINIVQANTRASVEKQVLLTAVIFLLFFLYVFSKKGYYKISAYLLIFAFLFPTFYMLLKWGADIPAMLMVLSLIIIMSGILINARFAALTTLIISLSLFFIAYLQQRGIIKPDLYWIEEKTPLVGDTLVHIIIFVIIATVSWLYNREIDRSLARALDSEAELKKERDFLELKVEERTRELKRTQLEKMIQLERFSEFGKVASGIFHDLANPLTVVSLNLEMLHRQSRHHEIIEVKQMQDTLETAIGATRRMEGFVASVKKQFKAGDETGWFNVMHEIRQASEMLSCLSRQKKVGIILSSQLRENAVLCGNPLKFSQIITNLLSNAIDSYDGTEKSGDARSVAVVACEKDGSVQITVEDKGSGISDEDKPKIFDLFFTTKKIGEGTGIGLATVKNIVEQHFGGAITFTSKPGEGSVFTVSLPLDKKPEA